MGSVLFWQAFRTFLNSPGTRIKSNLLPVKRPVVVWLGELLKLKWYQTDLAIETRRSTVSVSSWKSLGRHLSTNISPFESRDRHFTTAPLHEHPCTRDFTAYQTHIERSFSDFRDPNWSCLGCSETRFQSKVYHRNLKRSLKSKSRRMEVGLQILFQKSF